MTVPSGESGPRIVTLDAITLLTRSMPEAVAFHTVIGGPVVFGGSEAPFSTLRLGPDRFLNLQLDPQWRPDSPIWGRFIVFVESVGAVDDAHRRFVELGYRPETEPVDAPWGERYFHIRDPDGHQMSVAAPLRVRGQEARGQGGSGQEGSGQEGSGRETRGT